MKAYLVEKAKVVGSAILYTVSVFWVAFIPLFLGFLTLVSFLTLYEARLERPLPLKERVLIPVPGAGATFYYGEPILLPPRSALKAEEASFLLGRLLHSQRKRVISGVVDGNRQEGRLILALLWSKNPAERCKPVYPSPLEGVYACPQGTADAWMVLGLGEKFKFSIPEKALKGEERKLWIGVEAATRVQSQSPKPFNIKGLSYQEEWVFLDKNRSLPGFASGSNEGGLF